MRRNIYDILHSGNISLKTEYSRIHTLMNNRTDFYIDDGRESLYSLADCSCVYFDLEFTNRAISIKEIEKALGYSFPSSPRELTLDYLVSYCELSVNLCHQLGKVYDDDQIDKEYLHTVVRNVNDCMDKLGYTQSEHEGVFIFVEKSPAALAVAEISTPDLSYKVLAYNHHRLKGDLNAKLGILKLMADDLEPKRKQLESINKSLSSSLFQMLQKFVRHNCKDNAYIRTMAEEQIENCYDDIYQMWLLAKLELDNLERSSRVKEILGNINTPNKGVIP